MDRMDVELFEAPFGVHVAHCDRAIAPTGEPFVAICQAKMGADREETEAAALQAFKDYAAKRPGGMLYWRTTPEIRNPEDTGTPGLWSFYMRLLISNKDPRP